MRSLTCVCSKSASAGTWCFAEVQVAADRIIATADSNEQVIAAAAALFLLSCDVS